MTVARGGPVAFVPLGSDGIFFRPDAMHADPGVDYPASPLSEEPLYIAAEPVALVTFSDPESLHATAEPSLQPLLLDEPRIGIFLPAHGDLV